MGADEAAAIYDHLWGEQKKKSGSVGIGLRSNTKESVEAVAGKDESNTGSNSGRHTADSGRQAHTADSGRQAYTAERNTNSPNKRVDAGNDCEHQSRHSSRDQSRRTSTHEENRKSAFVDASRP
jgi:hypothetical protein